MATKLEGLRSNNAQMKAEIQSLQEEIAQNDTSLATARTEHASVHSALALLESPQDISYGAAPARTQTFPATELGKSS